MSYSGQPSLAIQNPKLPGGLIPRHYQVAAVDAVWDYIQTKPGNPLVVLPTGTGKALGICMLTQRVVQDHRSTRVLVLTHSKELVRQNFEEMLELWPACPAGIHSAGLKSRDIRSRVIFGSIQSIHRKAFALQQVDMIIVDEAQTIPRKGETMWLKFFDEVRKINPHVIIVGWTATAFRMDSGMLHEGEGAIFDEIVYEYSVIDAINEGFLTTPISFSSSTQIDTSDVGSRGGEFIPHDLEEVAVDEATVEAIAEEFVKAGTREDDPRRGWIMFGVGVKHCTMLRDAIRRRGISCEGIFAVTESKERDDNIAAFKAQKIRCLVSVNALAVGFNAKHTDLVGIARPTKSTGLFIQICGRVMRLWPGKANALIMDWGGNIQRHGFIDQPKVKAPGKGDGSIPLKVCDECGKENFIAARECVQCGAPFPFEGSKVVTKASNAPLLSTQAAMADWLKVKDTFYAPHNKPGSPVSMKVTYECGMAFYDEWVCFEHHHNGARKRAESWWKRRSDSPVPSTVEEAISRAGELKPTIEIQIQKVDRFVQVVHTKIRVRQEQSA